MEQLLTIIEAAQTTGKSIQTIRRMIKHKKIKVKRQKTPQGFNYMIAKDSLVDFFEKSKPTQAVPELDTQETTRDHRSLNDEHIQQFRGEVDRFNTTIQHLIGQMDSDKNKFFDLIKTFQDRVIILENQIKLLESPKHTWWERMWK
ncbi:helix-turn-helix domain-containing protein [Candidatus Gracilibacteria bacterium]|nr:helix-turn-helix domain-containing protein [Candidatus Gracilibacteria bacterium]